MITPMIEMKAHSFSEKTVCIVKFGPATPMDGLRPAEYYQVTIDPELVSGDFIRFGPNQGDELVGWQRIEALTVVRVIGTVRAGLKLDEAESVTFNMVA